GLFDVIKKVASVIGLASP
uniref:Citropin-1.1.3 n=1 Tax=Ranoidea citropa TaxID=94770 RepID=CT113_RANCI|nr:RecName: Full=Citropin-1.1.3 [Ranoidea citropa]